MNINLIISAQNNDREAQNQLIEENMGLVKNIARRFRDRGCEFEDLCQIGSIGLLKAIKRFDTSYEVQLSTYATPMIMGEIKSFLRDDGMIKISRKIKENVVKIKQFKEQFEIENHCEPTLNQISTALGLDNETIIMAIESMRGIQSTDEEIPILEKIHTGQDMERLIVDKLVLQKSFDRLNEIEKRIIDMRYFKDLTQTQIARMIKTSQCMVYRMEKKALNKILKEIGGDMYP